MGASTTRLGISTVPMRKGAASGDRRSATGRCRSAAAPGAPGRGTAAVAAGSARRRMRRRSC